LKRLIGLAIISVLIVIVTACGSASKQRSADDVAAAFKSANLSVDNTVNLEPKDFGMAPMKTKEAKRFSISSIEGDKAWGRIYVYENNSDLEEMKKFYDEIGKKSALFFTWLVAKDNVLIQFNREVPEDMFNKYKAALDAMK